MSIREADPLMVSLEWPLGYAAGIAVFMSAGASRAWSGGGPLRGPHLRQSAPMAHLHLERCKVAAEAAWTQNYALRPASAQAGVRRCLHSMLQSASSLCWLASSFWSPLHAGNVSRPGTQCCC